MCVYVYSFIDTEERRKSPRIANHWTAVFSLNRPITLLETSLKGPFGCKVSTFPLSIQLAFLGRLG